MFVSTGITSQEDATRQGATASEPPGLAGKSLGQRAWQEPYMVVRAVSQSLYRDLTSGLYVGTGMSGRRKCICYPPVTFWSGILPCSTAPASTTACNIPSIHASMYALDRTSVLGL